MRWILVLIVALSLTFIPMSSASAGCTVRADWLNRHTVARGENLYRIATRYGTTIGEMTAGNCLSDPNRIYVGQVLRVPGGNGSDTSGWTLLSGNPVALLAYPSRQSALIATLINENVLLLGRTADSNFLKVQTNTGLSGWMWSYDVPAHSDFIIRLPVIVEGNPTGIQGYIAGSFIRLRMGPGEQYRVLRHLSKQTVQILGKSSDLQWYKVQAGGYTGWVFSQLVTIDPNIYASIPVVN
ncbi:MAG: SH3 domain-containing protein [Anaerolineae bacterium]|nr:SH3 domain-containing protein [Anaerolineae bacterium]